MKKVRVPAQITSIEDTIYGTVTLKQFIVLLGVLILCFFFLIIIPPFYKPSLLKIILFTLIILIGLLLVHRPGRMTSQKLSLWFLGRRDAVFENKTIFEWLVLLFQYFVVRPKVYLHTKSKRLPQKLLKTTPVPSKRKTQQIIKEEKGDWETKIDPREFPLLMKVTPRALRAVLTLEKSHSIETLGGKEGETKYVYVEKVARTRAR